MTTESHRQGLNPSIEVYKPTITGGTYIPRGEFAENVTDQISSYSHTIDAVGGYFAASFTFQDRQDKIEDWIDKGLGRHIEVYDHTLTRIWEGFVNSINANLGPLAISRGPLLNVANRCNLVFSTVDTSTSPPTVGVRERAGIVEDNDSQASYGIIELYLSSGGSTPTEAAEHRNNYLAERKDPRTTQIVTLGTIGAQPSISIECLGYVHWFKKYVYNQTTTSGTYNLSVKMTDVISAQLNSIIDTGYGDIVANTLPVKRWENKDKTAWEILKTLTAMGDAADNRYLFGIYADRVPFYDAAPTTIEYQQRLADPGQRIETLSGSQVYPWNVLPGKWLLFSDLLIGATEPTTLRLDPRAMFIESVTYTTPWGLILKGGDTDKLSQKLAKTGLSGIGG